MEDAKQFIKDCLIAVGTSQENAIILADNLVTGDYRGFYTHGMARLGKYNHPIMFFYKIYCLSRFN